MNTEDDEFARIAREQALNKMADNARELGLDYELPITMQAGELDCTHAERLCAELKMAEQPTQQEPVGCEGAIVNGRVYADRLEHDYKFECEAGSLHLCTDWVEFRRCFEWLAQHTSLPAQQPAQQEPVACLVETEQGVMLWPIDDVNEAETYCEENEFPVLLYTSPPASKPLTDKEIEAMSNDFEEGYVFLYRSFARAIEAAHGIKENT